ARTRGRAPSRPLRSRPDPSRGSPRRGGRARRRRRSSGGPDRSWQSILPETVSEVEVRADAEVLHLVLVELAVGRMTAEVLEQDLELPRQQHAVDLDPRARRHVGAPPVLLALLDVDRGDRAPPGLTRRPGARELDPVLHRQGIEARGILVEEVA